MRHLSARLIVPALCAFLSVSSPVSAALPLGVDGQNLPSLAPMLKKATPAVVNISTKTKIQVEDNPLMRDPFFRHFFEIPNAPRERETSSLGSGVIVDARNGYILTNNHVIDKADEILVTLHDGRQLSAKLVGTDPESDVAVIKVEPKNLEELPIADSSQLQVGDFVVAIGNPFGLGQTVTSGIVSALGRSGLGIEGYEDFIQTDASINPGNSGGALVNLKGELIGINTAILAPNGGNVGIGFAIPSNMAANIKTTLIEHGVIRRGLLGVNIQDLSPDLAQAFGLNQTQGAVITAIQPGSPAAKAGIEPGDIVLAVNDRKIKSGAEVRNIVGLLQIGDKVHLDVLRRGETASLTAEIAAPKLTQEDGKKIHPKLTGTILGNAPPNAPTEGVIVEKIHSASYAFRAGLRPGDLLTMANRQPVRTLEDLRTAAHGRNELLLNIQRGDGAFFVMLR
ncbi:DegQ family serine endoprotease [Methylococcus sp. EFPC2]|uniref:DegQ family serine endoprotease n=1 Tax=Methylococcus sp. EFPC2 TaxID=2812648 RepID=UPI0019673017|nr:DegQ family serine endoprotease [Methylococcus sp. EFPC2]QSA95710.1 DegQ family serine endoprotease [Methylococcus sp. EFPC2]